MLGIPDGWVAAAFLLCLASTALCVVYGLATWNSGGDGEPHDVTEQWAKAEDELEEGL